MIYSKSTLPVVTQPVHSRKINLPKSLLTSVKRVMVEVKKVTNNLPYSCIVEIQRPANIDSVHYAILDSNKEKLLYMVAPAEEDVLPSFSIHDLQTNDKAVTLVLWPVVNGVEGTPTYYESIRLDTRPKLGTYDLEVDLKGADLLQFQKIKPLLEKYYGKTALPGVVKVQEAASDFYLPSTNVIHLSPTKDNFIHELIHASRKQLLFATKNYQFDEQTELIEEFFAEGVANLIKDDLSTDGLVYGSTLGYNYDFRIEDNALITQNVQSSIGGINVLELARYYLGAEAFHKIALEYEMTSGRFFAKDFNQRYYAILEQSTVDPDREMFFSICESLLPTIEGIPCRQWMANQKLFYCMNIPGDKIFMDMHDYHTSSEWVGITRIYLYETFENGNEWVYGKKRYKKNGEQVKIKVTRMHDGKEVYNGTPIIIGPDNGFGEIRLYFYHKKDSRAMKHFQTYNKANNFSYETVEVKSGLYEIELSNGNTVKRYYRIMGGIMDRAKDQLLIATPLSGSNTTLTISHTNKQGKVTTLAPQPFKKRLCVVEVPFIKNKNCEPGILNIVVDNGFSKHSFQRNIGYGGTYGGHQFWLGELRSVGV